MRENLFARAEVVRADWLILRSQAAALIARSNEDRRLRGLVADGVRFSKEVDQLIADSIDDLDVDDAAALLSDSRDLKAGIASMRDSLTRGPWVYQ